MITLESIISKRNQAAAFAHLGTKKTGAGIDNMELSELHNYWDMNGGLICESIRKGTYEPGPVIQYDIVNRNGSKRAVSKYNSIDRLVLRMIEQKLYQYYSVKFLENSFAYQAGKGTIQAANKAKQYIEMGFRSVVELDIKSYFDIISLERLIAILEEDIKDKAVIKLIMSYLYCTVIIDGNAIKKVRGIVQGSSCSPVLSNIYLHKFDKYLEEKGYNWIRFSDNISIYTDTNNNGSRTMAELSNILKQDFDLQINEQKSGVYDAYSRRFLGFDFIRKGKFVEIRRHKYQKKWCYNEWHPSVAKCVNQEYHILKNGVLNKKDFALLFENRDEKHHIPVEVTEQINLYNEVILPSAVLRTLSNAKIRLALFDKFGNLQGYYLPKGYTQDSKAVLAQCTAYNDKKLRLRTAKSMEIAAIHNIRANIRYYNKKNKELKNVVAEMANGIKMINEAKTIDDVLLIEARCRQIYYQAFNKILNNIDFIFESRTRRPPKDPVNSLIGFGNTLLYNRIQQVIWRTSLDSRIGVFHSANRRHFTLNLDFADVFKPIIVD